MRTHVFDKETPIVPGPFDPLANLADAVKTNSVRGNEVESSPKVGKGSLSFDSTDDARNPEQVSRGAEKRFVIGVEAKNVVSEKFADVKEVTGAAAEIENAQWSRAIEPKILSALDVDIDPVNDVLEAIDSGRARAVRELIAQLFELCAIQCFENTAAVNRMDGAAEMFERAREELGRKKFPELA